MDGLAHDRAESPAIHSIVAAMAASLVDDKAVSPEMQSATPMPTEPEIPGEGRFVPGTLLAGRYRIIGLLGRGGMGEVYRATDLTLGQSVALKFLPEEAARNQRLLERFHGEVRVARLVSHPNVCRVYDIGEAAAAVPFDGICGRRRPGVAVAAHRPAARRQSRAIRRASSARGWPPRTTAASSTAT